MSFKVKYFYSPWSIVCMIVLWMIYVFGVLPNKEDVVLKEFFSLGAETKYRVVLAEGDLSGLSDRRLFKGVLGDLFTCMKRYERPRLLAVAGEPGYAELMLENGMRLKVHSRSGVLTMFRVYGDAYDASGKYTAPCDLKMLNNHRPTMSGTRQ